MNYWRLRLMKLGGRGGSSTGARRRASGGTRIPGAVSAAQANAAAQQAQAAATVNAAPTQPTQPTPVPPAAPVGPATNTSVTSKAVSNFSSMSDTAMAAEIKKAVGVGMPNQLSDKPDATQQLVFSAGFNEKPMVLDQAGFNKFMKDNKLTTADLLSRDVNPVSYKNASNTQIKMTAQDVIDMMMYSRVNYIGGKIGGQALGAGTYFDHTRGQNTGYGGAGHKTAVAVLNPKTAKIITYSSLRSSIPSWRSSHPKSAKAIDELVRKTGGRNSDSIYALAMGYNVIARNAGAKGGYVNVIDRSALVYRAT